MTIRTIAIASLSAALVATALVIPTSADAGFLDRLLRSMPDTPRGLDPADGYRNGYVAPNAYRDYGDGYARPQAYAPSPYEQQEATPSRRFSRADPLMTQDPLHDTSLQPGDAVMTSDGIRVFVGDPMSDPHAPTDFVTATQARDVIDPSETKMLSSADPSRKALRIAYAKATTEGRSVDERTLVRGNDITDARGKVVRYVGP